MRLKVSKTRTSKKLIVQPVNDHLAEIYARDSTVFRVSHLRRIRSAFIHHEGYGCPSIVRHKDSYELNIIHVDHLQDEQNDLGEALNKLDSSLEQVNELSKLVSETSGENTEGIIKLWCHKSSKVINDHFKIAKLIAALITLSEVNRALFCDRLAISTYHAKVLRTILNIFMPNILDMLKEKKNSIQTSEITTIL